MNNQIQKNVIIVPTKYATQVWFHPKLVSVAFRDTNNFPHHIASAVAADFQPWWFLRISEHPLSHCTLAATGRLSKKRKNEKCTWQWSQMFFIKCIFHSLQDPFNAGISHLWNALSSWQHLPANEPIVWKFSQTDVFYKMLFLPEPFWLLLFTYIFGIKCPPVTAFYKDKGRAFHKVPGHVFFIKCYFCLNLFGCYSLPIFLV